MSVLTPKVWRLRVGTTTTDNEIRRSPNQLQKTLLEQFGTTDLLAGTAGGQEPVEKNHGFTLTRKIELYNDPTNLQKRICYNFQILRRWLGIVPPVQARLMNF